MDCLTCQQTKQIPNCTDDLVLGIIDYVSTNVYIFIENVTTGRVERQEATSSPVGVVTLDLTDPNAHFYSNSYAFEVHVSLRDTTPTEKLPIQLGGSTFDCFQLTFDKIIAGVAVADYTTHVLQLDTTFTEVVPIYAFDSNNNYYHPDFDTTLIEKWINQGSGNDAIQLTTAEQPLFINANLNGQDIFRMDNERYMDVTNAVETGTYFHAMVLSKPTGDNNEFLNGIYYHGGEANINDYYHAFSERYAQDWFQYDWGINGVSGLVKSANNIGINDAWRVKEIVYNNQEVKLFLDGEPIAAEIQGTIPATLPDFTQAGNEQTMIGGYNLLGTNRGYVGDIRCIKIWTTEPSATQRQEELLKMLAKI